jgi:2-isopropylmalate synthase
MKKDTVRFLDTTCRDGKQAPGNNHSPADTLRIAQRCADLGIDVFEAGFASSSEDDFLSVSHVAKRVPGITVCSLARALDSDIEMSARALENAISPPRLHTFIATSDIHLKHKLKMSRSEALEKAVMAVLCARRYVDDVQFSAEDATRTDPSYLAEVVREVILAGARTVNLPDTVGYAMPTEIASMVRNIITTVKEVSEYGVTIAVHCHNDLGFATANTLMGIVAGARQVECTVNGIGERAGNTHYAEVVMALSARADYYAVGHAIDTKKIGDTARLVSSVINKPIPDTLPIVGEHVFAHGAGIHQHGAMANEQVYEIMSPADVGWNAERFPLSSQSGRHGLRARLQRLGYEVTDDKLHLYYQQFLVVASAKVLVTDADLHTLVRSV